MRIASTPRLAPLVPGHISEGTSMSLTFLITEAKLSSAILPLIVQNDRSCRLTVKTGRIIDGIRIYSRAHLNLPR